MNQELKARLTAMAHDRIDNQDPSHDMSHVLRVLGNVEKISAMEGGDLDVLIPAALFHDLVNIPKNDPRAGQATELSAQETSRILQGIVDYPQQKIASVQSCIRECSFSKGLEPSSLESSILQDADLLESTGAISIMRTFASSGVMRRKFYRADDPFCMGREPEPRLYALDLFPSRLTKASGRMNTKTALAMAKGRDGFLNIFLKELEKEIG